MSSADAIERATLADLEPWTDLRAALWPGDRAALRAEAREWLDGDDRVAFLARRADGWPVGFAEAGLASAGGRAFVHVEGWYVAPDRRRQGLGRRLLEAVEEWALGRCAQALLSDTEPLRYPASLAAHGRAGYAPVLTLTILARVEPVPAGALTEEALVLDLLESLLAGPRPRGEVLDAWRTSCPRLAVWEEALAAGLIEDRGRLVRVTLRGRALWQARRGGGAGGPGDAAR